MMRSRRGPAVDSLTLASLVALGVGCVVESGSSEALLEDLPLREFVKRLELGAFDDSVLAFSRVTDVAEGPAGRIHIVQPLDGQVVVLTEKGEVVRRIGERGAGPGEFTSPAGVGWSGDTLWVIDVGTRRTSYFIGDSLVRTHSFQTGPGPDGVFVTTQMPLLDGTYAGVVAPAIVHPSEAPPPPTPILHLDSSGQRLGTLAELIHEHPPRIRLGQTRTTTLFHDLPLFEVSRRGDRIVVVERPLPSSTRSVLRVTVISPRGDTVSRTELIGEAVPLSDRLWAERLQERREALPDSRIDEAEYLAAVVRPDFLPPASGLVVGVGGWIWIAREDVRTSATREWVALDPMGEPRFRAVLPRSFRAYDATDRRIWGVSADSLGIPYVQMYEASP